MIFPDFMIQRIGFNLLYVLYVYAFKSRGKVRTLKPMTEQLSLKSINTYNRNFFLSNEYAIK